MATEIEVVPNQNPLAVIIIPTGATVVSGPDTDPTGQVHLVAKYGDWLVAITAGPPVADPERPRRSEPGDPYPDKPE